MDRWVPSQFRVDIATVDGSPVPVANDFQGVAVDGFATGSVTVAGEAGTILITGDVTATSTEITLSERPQGPRESGPGSDLRVDMTVRTARGVQFLWPTNTFPILRGFADANEAVRIRHESASNTFSVTGGVEIQGGEVFYFDRSFYIREGRITFEEDEQGFDPLLSVNAEIREVADEGPIEIYLVADERPLSQFTPRWRSDPPLSEASILALLGGNVFVGQGGDPIDIGDAVLLGSDVLSQFAIIRGFESSVRETLQLDLFSVRTQLFQNLLRGVISPDQRYRDGDYPLDNTTPSLGQYLDNTTLFMGKYLGTDLFLELLVQLRASEASALEPRSLAGIEMEAEFGLEWQTPFFLLEWNFFPRDPSTLFLADNTISFSWEYSY
jgi:translocation and assembly module TamB